MSAAAVEERLRALRQKLGRKQHFEEAVADLAATLRDRYADASPVLRKSMYSTVCRVATVLQTRYTAPGFWRAGLNLFIGTEKLVTNPSEKEHLKTCISRAQELLVEKENEEYMPSNREAEYYGESQGTPSFKGSRCKSSSCNCYQRSHRWIGQRDKGCVW